MELVEVLEREAIEPVLQTSFQDFMPHGPGIVLVDRVLEVGPGSALCKGSKLTAKSSLWLEGEVSSCSGVEYIAQAALAGKIVGEVIGHKEIAREFNPSGAIVRVKGLEFNSSGWASSEEIFVDVAWTANVGSAFNVSGAVLSGAAKEILVKAELTILDTA